MTVVTSEPFDKELVGNIANDLGEITLFASGVMTFKDAPPNGTGSSVSPSESGARTASASVTPQSVSPQKDQGKITFSENKQGTTVQVDQQVLQTHFHRGSLPSAADKLDFEIPLAGTSLFGN